MTTKELKVDPELQSFFPPLDDEALKVLTDDIVSNGGANVPIIVWKSKNTIVDGHNRYAICTANGLTFDTDEREFRDAREAKLCMLQMQLGRRNLTDMMRTQLMGTLHNLLKKGKAENLKGKGKAKAEANVEEETAKQVGDQFGVSSRTVKRAGQVAKGIEAVAEEKGKDVAAEVVAGKTDATKADLETAGKAKTPEAKAAAVETAVAPKPKAKPKAKEEIGSEMVRITKALHSKNVSVVEAARAWSLADGELEEDAALVELEKALHVRYPEDIPEETDSQNDDGVPSDVDVAVAAPTAAAGVTIPVDGVQGGAASGPKFDD